MQYIGIEQSSTIDIRHHSVGRNTNEGQQGVGLRPTPVRNEKSGMDTSTSRAAVLVLGASESLGYVINKI